MSGLRFCMVTTLAGTASEFNDFPRPCRVAGIMSRFYRMPMPTMS